MTAPSWQSRLLAQVLARTARPLGAHLPLNATTLPWIRRAIDRAAAGTGRLPRGTTWEPVVLPACRAELVRAPAAAPVLLYLHGGGFIAGSARAWRPFVAALSACTGLPVLSVDYRLVPEHTIGDATEDALDAYRWLVGRGVPEAGIVLAGDSAGGGLALAVATRLRAEGRPGPGGIAVISPWADLDPVSRTPVPDPFLSANCVAQVTRLCTAGGVALPPPADTDLRGLPPTLIIAGEHDFLRHDSELLARLLGAAGVPVELVSWPGQSHAFPLARGLPEARAALRRLARFVKALPAPR
ncbi:acetyl esterase/lipase [Amycolatopsis lexingtonensis]|uniref:Acetyl esterase/lipase n=1 Tax=Amycolatopsis lexingtonensis TaxID=218822 RepID=A0ABR9HYP4_9PSEU|nr:alpha/beta hydrolase [Amycolatopsis lexingtonensis]MBE1496028.1 acetyl esterase/lipase [Amycolatopsis lexingtonensis]